MKRAPLLLLAALFGIPLFSAENPGWNPVKAAERLDARALEWKSHPKTQRPDKTSCISCHSGSPYLFTRPLLGRLLGEREPAEPEKALLADVALRVSKWSEVEPWYSYTEEKTKESRGTEAILNALVLSFRDRASHRKEPSEITRNALENLWSEQREDGGFSWLHFELAPWETDGSDVFGACLAAVAASSADADESEPFRRLAAYLRSRSSESLDLHTRIGILWASAVRPDLLPEAERRAILDDVLAIEQPGGGFRLGDLGSWKRKNQTPDAYATGLVVYVLAHGRDPESKAAVARGLAWLAAHQESDGGWRAESPNKDRTNDEPLIEGFLSDAASAYAVLALTAPASP
ncbi:MAG: prenyltransferase/squalene oxidase repeat-containing protein [Vicinamibacteria bacterium]